MTRGLLPAMLLAFGSAAAQASDSDARPVRRWQAEVALGARWGAGTVAGDLRMFAAGLWPLAPAPAAGPLLALGVHVGVGAAAVRDPRGVDGVVTDRRLAIGPEGRLTWAAGGDVWRGYGFVAAAPIWIAAPDRNDRLPEGGGAPGLRLSAGIGAPWFFYPYRDEGPKSCDGGTCGIALMAAVLPTLIELTYETVGGWHHRFGFAVGYTF